jgi:hypothetical protein
MADLLVGEQLLPLAALVTQKIHFLACFDAAQERRRRFLRPREPLMQDRRVHRRILWHLGVAVFEGGFLLLAREGDAQSAPGDDTRFCGTHAVW